jgi:hypothetical protein
MKLLLSVFCIEFETRLVEENDDETNMADLLSSLKNFKEHLRATCQIVLEDIHDHLLNFVGSTSPE